MEVMCSFVFPLYNEETRIASFPEMREYLLTDLSESSEFILVCNGSTDRTPDIIREFESRFSDVIAVVLRQRGRGGALRAGFRQARGDLVAVCAIDRAWDEAFYVEAKDRLVRNDADIVYGPKSHPESIVHRSVIRTVVSLCSRLFIAFLFGGKRHDTQCIKMFRRTRVEFLEDLGDYNYFAETEFVLRAERLGLRTLWLPVRIHDNGQGSKVRLSSLVEFMIEAISFRLYLIGSNR